MDTILAINNEECPYSAPVSLVLINRLGFRNMADDLNEIILHISVLNFHQEREKISVL